MGECESWNPSVPPRARPVNILVTAGNTLVPIDRVRAITNIFSGRTGTRIALEALERGHRVQLLTSHPELAEPLASGRASRPEHLRVQAYRLFEELHSFLSQGILQGQPDAVIHAAAVNDYHAAGIYAPVQGTQFQAATGVWTSNAPSAPQLQDRAAGKVKSDEPELWLRLLRSPKLVDSIRRDWGFRGILVKFKLEVGVRDDELLAIAEPSRTQSQADLMVANTLEGMEAWALLGAGAGSYQRIPRAELPCRLLEKVEHLHEERKHG